MTVTGGRGGLGKRSTIEIIDKKDTHIESEREKLDSEGEKLPA